MKTDSYHFVGLDLGQAQDYTAVAVLETPTTWASRAGPTYALRHLKRFPLGTPYPQVVDDMRDLLCTSAIERCIMVVDQTAVGRAVINLFRLGLLGRVECQGLFIPITITAGHIVNYDSPTIQVPKKELVGVLQALLQTRRLQIARSLPEAALLSKELENFRVKPTVAGNETLEAWREGQHDDLVLAVALAAWMGEETLLRQVSRPAPTRLVAV